MWIPLSRKLHLSFFRSSQWLHGRNAIAYDFSSRSLMVTFEGYTAYVTWDTESRIYVSRYVHNYHDSIQEMSNFFPLRCNFACTDRHAAACRAHERATSLESSHATFSRWNVARSCADEIFYIDEMHLRGDDVVHTNRGTRCQRSCFSIPSRAPRFTMSRFDNNHGTAWNWNFRTSKDRPWTPLQRARVKRASCHSTDINGQFRSVCAFTIDRSL